MADGDYPTRLSVFDFDFLFQKEVEIVKTAIAESNAVVTRGELPTVRAHGAQFRQLVQNLIANALKYRAKRAPRIHVAASKTADAWRLDVADNGESAHCRVFRAKQVRSHLEQPVAESTMGTLSAEDRRCGDPSGGYH